MSRHMLILACDGDSREHLAETLYEIAVALQSGTLNNGVGGSAHTSVTWLYTNEIVVWEDFRAYQARIAARISETAMAGKRDPEIERLINRELVQP